MNITNTIKNNLINLPGWRTNRRIVVFESDDWGSIRMPSKKVYSEFLKKGFDIKNTAYNRLDALEENSDLEDLFEVLMSLRHPDRSNPVITANIVVGNPDFDRIRKSNFLEYHYEPVTETVKHYQNCHRIVSLWKEGQTLGIYHPQFHGREHVNISRWMDALKQKSSEIMFAFNLRTTLSGKGDYNFMEVLDYRNLSDLPIVQQSLTEGLEIFEKLFGYSSKSFIPPCYIWSHEIEETLHLKGVRYIQGVVVQSIPTGTYGVYRRKYHFMGRRNNYDQVYLTRNCFFEPSLVITSDPVGECLRRVNIAFNWGKPAIICSHRINYVGSLVRKNQKENLIRLKELFQKIRNNWPEVEFMTSDQLGDIITDNHS